MKKFFSLIAAVLFAGSMMADDVTVTKTVHDLFPDDANGTQEATLFSDSYITISVNADGNNGKVYGTGTEWRLYQSNNAVVTVAATNATIKTVAFEFIVANTGVLKFGNDVMESNVAVNVNAASAQFAVANSGTATNGQVKVKGFTVVYEASGAPAPVVEYYVVGTMNNWTPSEAYKLAANPGDAGEFMADFTFAANDLLKVRRTTDGEADLWYPDGIDNNFAINEAGRYTIYFRPDGQGGEGWHYGCIYAVNHPLINCAAAAALAKDEVAYLDEVQVTYVNGSNIYIKDESGYDMIFSYNFGLKAGDVVNGFVGKSSPYHNLPELVPTVALADLEVAEGEAPAPEEIAAAPTAADVNKYLVIKGVELAGEFTAQAKGNLTATIGEETFTLYNNFKIAYTFEAGKKYDIVGVGNIYDDAYQLYFISASEHTATAIDNAAAEIKAIKRIENGQLVIIKNGVRYNAVGTVVR